MSLPFTCSYPSPAPTLQLLLPFISINPMLVNEFSQPVSPKGLDSRSLWRRRLRFTCHDHAMTTQPQTKNFPISLHGTSHSEDIERNMTALLRDESSHLYMLVSVSVYLPEPLNGIEDVQPWIKQAKYGSQSLDCTIFPCPSIPSGYDNW